MLSYLNVLIKNTNQTVKVKKERYNMTEEIKQVEETTTEEVAAETVVEAEENVEQLPAKRQRGRKKRVETQEVKPESEWKEQVVQIRRVTKVVKGGKKLSFRAIVIVGNKKVR